MTHQDPLQRTVAEFAKWRANKTSRGNLTPTALKQQALALTEHYSINQVVSALGLTHSVLKRWREQLSDNDPIEQNHTFIELPHPITLSIHIQQATLIFDEQSSLQLSGPLSMQLLTMLTQARG